MKLKKYLLNQSSLLKRQIDKNHLLVQEFLSETKNNINNSKDKFTSVHDIINPKNNIAEILKDENDLFIELYSKTKQLYPTKVEETFKDLILQYKNNDYKIPDLSDKKNLFNQNPLLLVGRELEQFYMYNEKHKNKDTKNKERLNRKHVNFIKKEMLFMEKVINKNNEINKKSENNLTNNDDIEKNDDQINYRKEKVNYFLIDSVWDKINETKLKQKSLEQNKKKNERLKKMNKSQKIIKNNKINQSLDIVNIINNDNKKEKINIHSYITLNKYTNSNNKNRKNNNNLKNINSKCTLNNKTTSNFKSINSKSKLNKTNSNLKNINSNSILYNKTVTNLKSINSSSKNNKTNANFKNINSNETQKNIHSVDTITTNFSFNNKNNKSLSPIKKLKINLLKNSENKNDLFNNNEESNRLQKEINEIKNTLNNSNFIEKNIIVEPYNMCKSSKINNNFHKINYNSFLNQTNRSLSLKNTFPLLINNNEKSINEYNYKKKINSPLNTITETKNKDKNSKESNLDNLKIFELIKKRTIPFLTLNKILKEKNPQKFIELLSKVDLKIFSRKDIEKLMKKFCEKILGYKDKEIERIININRNDENIYKIIDRLIKKTKKNQIKYYGKYSLKTNLDEVNNTIYNLKKKFILGKTEYNYES